MTPRRWLELRVRHPGDTEASIPDTLVALGARGVVEEPDRFVAYFEEPDDLETFLTSARARLARESGAEPEDVSWAWQDHREWAELWKRGLGPRRITERIVVHPSWAPAEDTTPEDVVIVLDPGMAFGTAEHGTTRGCLRLLDDAVAPGSRVLDVGAGSGILSIAAARLGAEEVVAVEGDALACEAMRENLERNGVDGAVRVDPTWADADDLGRRRPFDGVVANIETGLLTPLLPGLCGAVADDGWLVLSGILGPEWDAVEGAVGDLGFTVDATDADGEWRSGRFRRVGAP